MPDWLVLVLTVVALVGLGAPLYVIIGGFVFTCYALFPVQPDAFGADFFRNFDPTESMASFADQPALAAIPFFMIAGAIMGRGSIAKRLVDVAEAFFGWLPGGLAVSAIFACVFFAAISGSSPVTVVTIGAVMVPALKEAGYTDRMAHGLVTAAGGLGIIIPPSIPMVVFAIYATLSGHPVHVEEIFIAGILPGIFIALLLSVYCMITGRKVPRKKLSFRRMGQALLDGAWSLFLPAFILGGIATGMFDAVEAAAISVVLAIVVELFIHKSLKVHELPSILSEMAVLMGSILLIIAVAGGFSEFVEIKEIPDAMVAWIRELDPSPLEFALILNLVLLVVGCFLDIISAIVLFVPLLVPLSHELGFDPLHIGIIFIVNLEIGYLTPPLGLNLFV
ncbi:MAG: TRAP transporter large permease, partial [Myxococcales bacterium]|nr:TRAP transporter large permease [Myxococcales bacterium]